MANFSKDIRSQIDQAAKLLREGSLVIVPTETVYGLAARCDKSEAVAKIFELKKRPKSTALIIHVGGIEEVKRLTDWQKLSLEEREANEKLMKAFWPGALTLVLPRLRGEDEIVCDEAVAGMDSVAVRMSSHPILKEIIKKVACPLAAPSANEFTRLSPSSEGMARAAFGERLPMLVDGGKCEIGIESTIVELKGKTLRIIRSGKISRSDLHVCLGKDYDIFDEGKKSAMHLPGEHPKHYSPQTPCFLLKARETIILRERRSDLLGVDLGLVNMRGLISDGFIDSADYASIATLSPLRGDFSEAAKNLYTSLFALDKQRLKAIFIEPVARIGFGEALSDRIERACSGKTVADFMQSL